MKKYFYTQILREYETHRQQQTAQQQKRQAQVYERVPQVARIDNEISLIGIEIAKSILHKPMQAEQMLQALEQKSQKLEEQKAELLLQNGFAQNFLQASYRCRACKDTGYVEMSMCVCFKQRLIDKAYEMSNLAQVVELENFDTFNISYYSEEQDKHLGMTARTKMMKNLSTCMKFTENFDKQLDNLYLYGKSGLGKTFMCHAIAKQLLDDGKTVIYVTAFQLFKMIEKNRFNKDEGDEHTEYIDAVLDVDLLIIDDLGTEFSTILSSSELFNIINQRLIDKRHTVISTNLSPNDLINHYSDRLVSRVQGSYQVLKFIGKDIRLLKKYYGQ